MYSEDVIACAKLVERGDPLRFRSVMAAPSNLRPALFTLFAFNLEVARAPWVTKRGNDRRDAPVNGGTMPWAKSQMVISCAVTRS